MLGNKTIKQIRKLHQVLKINSVLNRDEVLVKLSAIIEVRNCITHSAGKVLSQRTVARLRNYAIHHEVGETIELRNNILDDFLHYMVIHILGFLNEIP